MANATPSTETEKPTEVTAVTPAETEDTTEAEPVSPAPPRWSFPTSGERLSTTPGDIVGRPRPALASGLAARTGSPVPTPPAPSHGPSGKRRSPIAVVALSIVTLGVYALVWHRRINTEMSDFDTRMHVRAGRSTLAVTLPWIAGLLISVAGAGRIVLDQAHITLTFDPHFTVLQGYYLLAGLLVVPYLELIVAFSAIAVVMTLERLRMAEERSGRTTDVQVRPTTAVWLLMLPVIGGMILQAIVQRRLNEVWDRAEPSPLARISQY